MLAGNDSFPDARIRLAHRSCVLPSKKSSRMADLSTKCRTVSPYSRTVSLYFSHAPGVSGPSQRTFGLSVMGGLRAPVGRARTVDRRCRPLERASVASAQMD